MMTLKSIKGKLETKFSWMHADLQLLIQSVLKSKSKCEFEGESWESKRSECGKKLKADAHLPEKLFFHVKSSYCSQNI